MSNAQISTPHLWAKLIALFESLEQNNSVDIKIDILYVISALIVRNFRPPIAFVSHSLQIGDPPSLSPYTKALGTYIKWYNVRQESLRRQGEQYDEPIYVQGGLMELNFDLLK